MKIREILEDRQPSFSFEFFPPKTQKGWGTLFRTIEDLIPLEPAYVSVTYGAGGTTRERTHELVERIVGETDLEVVAHLTCVGSSEREIGEILERYSKVGVHNILALKGDIPMGGGDEPPANGFQFASDLVRFIRKNFPDMGVGVAGFPEGHPDTPNRLREIEFLKAKTDAGADYIVTQMFFDNRDFYDFRDRCRISGINVPIIAGIMPITSRKTMVRMAELAAGARFPATLLKAIARATTDAAVKNIGVHWATTQISDLLYGDVAGVHLYTLNASGASMEICKSLGLDSYRIPASSRF
jgi:methylenetetrahydrofolate reductase (NADPH)